MWHFLPPGGEEALMLQKFLQVTPAKGHKVLQEHPQHFPRYTFLTFLPWAQPGRDDSGMFMLRVAAVITLQVYTAAFLRASIEFSIGAFIDI